MFINLLNLTLSTMLSFAGAVERETQAVISCATHPLTSSYYLSPNSSNEGKIELYIAHHNGTEHAPLFDGTMTGYTIELMQKRFEDVKKMGEQINLNFKKENCIYKESSVFCFNNESSPIGNLPVQAYSFSARKEAVKTSGITFDRVFVSLSYRISSRETHTLSTSYFHKSCLLNLDQES